MTEQIIYIYILVGKATVRSGLRFGRSEVLRNLRHYACEHKAEDTIPRKHCSIFLERTREGHRQSHEPCIGTVSKTLLGKFQREWFECTIWAFPSA